MRHVRIWAAAGMVVILAGCASERSHSYAGYPESERNTVTAERLNHEACRRFVDSPLEAERLLRQALAADLFYGPAHNNLGVLLLGRGELYQASEEFQWAARLMPGHPDPRMNLGLTLELAGRVDDALATYHTALEVYPDHIQTLQALTRLQVRAGKADERTTRRLSLIGLRGDSDEWRQWAMLEASKPH